MAEEPLKAGEYRELPIKKPFNNANEATSAFVKLLEERMSEVKADAESLLDADQFEEAAGCCDALHELDQLRDMLTEWTPE